MSYASRLALASATLGGLLSVLVSPASSQDQSEFFRDCRRRPRTTEAVQNEVSRITTRLDNAFKQGFWLLCWVADTLKSLRIDC